MDFTRKHGVGFVYHMECYSPDGKLLWQTREENILPDEGRDYLMNAGLNVGAQFGSWFIGLYEGNYGPVAADTMATFPASATEITAYSETARVELVDEPLASGLWANSVTKAQFTFTATKTVRGAFISSGSVKGGTTGVLLSAVLASSPKTVNTGEILQVVAGLSLVTL